MSIVASFVVAVAVGCSTGRRSRSTCDTCHQGIEVASPTHADCVSCHGGDATAMNKDTSHRTLFGGKNPSAPSVWEKTCGRCHPYQLERMRSNLMYTNTGMVKNIQETWEGVDGRLYSSQEEKLFNAGGRPVKLEAVASLDHLSGELYRKFCSLCHVRIPSYDVYAGSHAAGCAACHFPYNEDGTYRGADKTVSGKWPYSANHRMASLPDNAVCARCHNRSGRIALYYEGWNDGNNSLVPTKNGLPGPAMISGARNATSIAPDVHHAKGLDCIDCHTSRDVMGDGYAYENMFLQTEIRCEDCHGSAVERPRLGAISRENDEAVREAKSYKVSPPVAPGSKRVLTAKGRMYSNVFPSGGKLVLLSKRKGTLHECKVITGTPEHTIAGHERMECYSCHSRTAAQCYGCHTRYDQTAYSKDFIKGYDTPGAFSETEDYRALYPFPLAMNQRGRISPVTPGCQTFVTVVGRTGEREKDEYVALYGGKRQLRFAPFYSHNTGTKAIGCAECHANPAFLGFGQHVVRESTIEGTLLCERSDEKPLDGFLSLTDGRVRAFSAITRKKSRPLNAAEVKKTLSVNLCLVCHDKPTDPIYQKKLDYRELPKCLARPVSARR